MEEEEAPVIWTHIGPTSSSNTLKTERGSLVPKQFRLSNLLNRLAWFCVLCYGFRGYSALVFRLVGHPGWTPVFSQSLHPRKQQIAFGLKSVPKNSRRGLLGVMAILHHLSKRWRGAGPTSCWST